MTSETQTDHIDHDAIVEAILLSEKKVRVRMVGQKECEGCAAMALCGIKGESDELEISDPNPGRFSVGDHVTIVITESLHHKAIMLATVIPCMVLILSMTGIFLLTGNQGLSVGIGICLLTIFYLILYLMRDKLAHEFVFTLKQS